MSEEEIAIPRLAVVGSTEPERQTPLTDPLEVMAMRLFVQQYSNTHRFNHTDGVWLAWDGSRWAVDEKKQTLNLMINLAQRIRAQDPSKRAALGKIAFSEHALRGATTDPDIAVTSSDLDQDPMLLGIPGGYIDLRTGRKHKPDPRLLISKSTSVVPLEKADCPIFKEFIRFASGGSAELEGYLQRYFGYCLTGLMKEEIITFFYGPGGNGKGVLLKTISKIMGEYAASTPSSTFMETRFPGHPTEIADLQGRRLVTASETSEGAKFNIGRLKEITGNETPLKGRKMGKDFSPFWPVCKILIVGNSQPRLGDVEAAVTRRLRMVEFMQVAKEPDNTLKDRLEAEYPAILRWLLQGLKEYFKVGLAPPAGVVASSQKYLAQEDVVSQYITKCIEFRSVGILRRKDISTTLSAFLKQNGITKKVTVGSVYKVLRETHELDDEKFHELFRCFSGCNLSVYGWDMMALAVKEAEQEMETNISDKRKS